MTDTDNTEFQLHPDTCVRNAVGDVLFTAASLTRSARLPGWRGEADQASDGRQLRVSGPESVHGLCLVRDDSSDTVLRKIFQAVWRGIPFCVIPKGRDSASIDGVAGDAAKVEEALAEDVHCGARDMATSALAQFHCLSSGSSGTARRIQRSHQSWIRSFDVNAEMLQISASDRYAIVGSLSHSLPLYASLEACHLGADLHLLRDLRPDRQLRALHTLGTTVLYLTPAQARQLCRARPAGHRQKYRIRHVLCGGGKLDEKTRCALHELFAGASIVEFYGASETSFMTMSTEQTPLGSVGCAYPGVSLKVLDDDGEATTGVGEIWVQSQYLFTGYSLGGWRDTRQVQGYLSIGELGQLDEAGFLYLRGRKSRQANVADTSVFLEEIEAVLLEHSALDHCVVVARHDALRGEILLAVVQGHPDESRRKELLSFARRRLGPVLAPRDILFIQTMPYLAAGKPDIGQIQGMVDSL